MANIPPDHRETRPKTVQGRTDAWLRRNDPRFARRVRKIERRENLRRIAIEKLQK